MSEPVGSGERLKVDVAVIGGGLAGLATTTHLARRHQRVVCLEPRPWPRQAVGESLEFSAPKLLDALGLDLEAGEVHGYLFPKTSVQISGNGETFEVWPPGWFARPPIWCSRLAYHTDRTELDQRLLKLALQTGGRILPERVVAVERSNDRITGLTTDAGTSITARWYVDATGHETRLFGRALGLEREPLGDPRIAYWTRFDQPPQGHGTKLYFPRPFADDLSWVWEIPLNPREVSVGVVLSTAEAKAQRSGGHRPHDIYSDRVSSIPALRRLTPNRAKVDISTTTYAPYRHRRCIGPNWLLVGDACAMVDPLTSNGVTAALRHADQAARFITLAANGRRRSRCRAWAFEATAPAVVGSLDTAIESFLYHSPVRQTLGLRPAVTLYAATGVVTNSLYAKLNPVTVPRALACAAMLAASRIWSRTASTTIARMATPFRRLRRKV